MSKSLFTVSIIVYSKLCVEVDYSDDQASGSNNRGHYLLCNVNECVSRIIEAPRTYSYTWLYLVVITKNDVGFLRRLLSVSVCACVLTVWCGQQNYVIRIRRFRE